MDIFTAILLLFLLAAVAPFINASFPRISGWILSLPPIGIFLWLLSLVQGVSQGEIHAFAIEWLPALGINLMFRLDGLSLLFALLVTGIGGLIMIYAGYYMRSYQKTNRFFGYLVFFMASMLGLVAANDWISLFMFWELTSLSSFLLIGFKHEKEAARKAALQALLITGLGGLALLAGLILMSLPYQSFAFDAVFSNPDLFTQSPLFIPATVLLLIGAFTKSAIFPFHFWLPGAMQAPSPVSAYLHSATMVKAGIYLIARLHPVMEDQAFWTYSLSLFGAFTMFVGAWFAVSQQDIKKILAYTTVSALGTLVLLIGTSTAYSVTAALVFLLVHAFYKATLFMMAGNIEKKTSTRDIRLLGGLSHFMPIAALISMLALLSMSGIPPMLGFIGKELMYEAKLNAPKAGNFILLMGFLANAFTVFVSARIAFDVFYGKCKWPGQLPKEPALSLSTGPAVLVIISLLFGVFPNSAAVLLEPALKSILPAQTLIHLKLWHGFNEILLLSALTVLLGAVLFAFRTKVIAMVGLLNGKYFNLKLSERFFLGIDLFIRLTKKKTTFIQHGYHRFYLMTILITASVLLFLSIFKLSFPLAEQLELNSWTIILLAAAVLIMVGAIATVVAQSRLVALVSTGISGIGITVIFVLFSGVDCAITMIMVETLTIVIGAMVVYHLPKYLSFSNKFARWRDMSIALLFGVVMGTLAFLSANKKPMEKVSDYYLENSLSKGYGENVVNVILVDFRALDTLGEIIVLGLAAIGIVALLTLNKTKSKN
ncbi:MAG: DUF4040 domain-containing protein [Bacteroidetes bacterium]|nr:DUF4040 domain-containing protein [Bacteroidota bacterium]MBU1579963.1 DUF4040 domain-containing protein [Bacteroidota bacterium]MBU2464813.1 DUF4040 domain-containing protein [Bacteroidota bacterium]MBU2558014.1 DUF4040 domain-containing protein [Bacteroidota bacterium]